MTATVAKLATVAADINQVESQANQDAITVNNLGNDNYTIEITNGATLNAFESTDPAQGVGEWIGLVIDTGEDSIIGVKFNGYALSAADAAEATSVGVPAGSFVWWIDANALPKTATLAVNGKEDAVINIDMI